MKQFMANYCVIHLNLSNQINHKPISQINGFICRSKSGNWTKKLKDGHREKNAQNGKGTSKKQNMYHTSGTQN